MWKNIVVERRYSLSISEKALLKLAILNKDRYFAVTKKRFT
jgi:hypothetical protein